MTTQNRNRLISLATLLCCAVSGCSAGAPPGSGVAGIGIAVVPTEAAVEPAGSVQFTGTVTGATLTDIVWSVSEAPSCGSITQAALYSAPLTPGPCRVVATSVADATKSAAATVTVVAPPPGSITISPGRATVAVGATQQFAVVPSVPVTWTVTETAAAPVPPTFPVAVSANGRFLVGQNGRPFFMVGDSPQTLAHLSVAERRTYLAARAQQGFNTIQMYLLCWDAAQQAGSCTSGGGAYPFATRLGGGAYAGSAGTADFAAPNETYFAFIDGLLDDATSFGFLVQLYALDWGFGGTDGWWRDIVANSASSLQALGTFLGNRYGSRTNVMWVDGSDYDGDGGPQNAKVVGMVQAMRAAGANQPRFGDWNADSLSTDRPQFVSYQNVNGIYAYGTSTGVGIYSIARRAWNYAPTIPAFMKETTYEGENGIGGGGSGTSPPYLRKVMWWSHLSGGTAGGVWGSSDWNFKSGWQSRLSSVGALDMQRLSEFVRSLDWQRLAPSELSGMRRLVTSANGTQTGSPVSYVAAAADPAGALALAYVPSTGTSPQTITFDLRQMAGPARARWWNPTTGAFTAIGSYPNTLAAQSFSTPGNNGAGANDWVLVLDLDAARCGTISTDGLYAAPATLPVGATCQVTATVQSNPAVVAQAAVDLL